MKLSKRLYAVATFLSQGSFFADIGTDHAYLPCYVCLQDKNAHAIAGEVSEGPFKSAYKTVKAYGLENVIDVRLGNGLEVLQDDQITELVIAGMGGALITEILENGKKTLDTVQRIITQPNIGERRVRKWFLNNGFTLTNEVIIKEGNHIYEILVADKGVEANPYQMDQFDKQIYFGPLLLNEKSPIFYEKWQSNLYKTKDIINQMKQAKIKNKAKLHKLKLELEWIKEVLQNEKTS